MPASVDGLDEAAPLGDGAGRSSPSCQRRFPVDLLIDRNFVVGTTLQAQVLTPSGAEAGVRSGGSGALDAP